MYSREWDNFVLQCRGLITYKGDVIARPWPKFFNVGETPETQWEKLPSELPEVTTKYDGSLGILYKYKDIFSIATRGSFDSDQARKANKLLDQMDLRKTGFNEAWTYLLEIIYPENQVVVDYGDMQALVLIGIVETETGKDFPGEKVVEEANRLGFTTFTPKKMSPKEIQAEMDKNPHNQEGLVLRYSDGFRVKAKYEEYFRIHRLIAGMSLKRIWELLIEGEDVLTMVDSTPELFKNWTVKEVNRLTTQFESISEMTQKSFKQITKEVGTEDRKAFALKVLDSYKYISSPLFAMYDGKDPKPYIWKMMKPKSAKVFLEEEKP